MRQPFFVAQFSALALSIGLCLLVAAAVGVQPAHAQGSINGTVTLPPLPGPYDTIVGVPIEITAGATFTPPTTAPQSNETIVSVSDPTYTWTVNGAPDTDTGPGTTVYPTFTTAGSHSETFTCKATYTETDLSTDYDNETPPVAYYTTTSFTTSTAVGSVTADVTVVGTFTITPNPLRITGTTVHVPYNTSAPVPLLVTSTGQIGPVDLTAGAPPGDTLTSGVSLSVTSTVGLASATSVIPATLTISLASTVMPGSYPIEVSGASDPAGTTATCDLTLVVDPPYFSLTLEPPSLVAYVNDTIPFSIAGYFYNGLTGSMTLNPVVAPSGPVVAFGSTTFPTASPSSTATFSGTLAANENSVTPDGDYYLTLTPTNTGPYGTIANQLVPTITTEISVARPSLIATPTAVLYLLPGQGSTTGTLQLNGYTGLDGSVSVSSTVQDAFGNSSTGLALTCPSSVAMTRKAYPDETSLGSGALAIQASATAAGTYTIIFTCVRHYAFGNVEAPSSTLTINVMGPAFSSTPGAVTVGRGGTVTETAAITSVNGFAGTVSYSGSASGISISGSGTPSSGASLTITAGGSVPNGSYSVPVTETSGTITQSVDVSVNVVGKLWSPATPISGGTYSGSSPLVMMVGAATSVSVATASDNDTWTSPGLTGATVADTISYHWSGNNVTDSSTNSLTWTAPMTAGNYRVTCKTDDGGLLPAGDSGSLNDPAVFAKITMQVEDFSATAADVTVSTGGTETTQATITGLNGFAGTVSFTGSDPSGITVSGSGTPTADATLTVTAGSAPAGTYALTLTATSGSVSHPVTLNVTVTPVRVWDTGAAIVINPLTADFTSVGGGATVHLVNSDNDPDHWQVPGTSQQGTDVDNLTVSWDDGNGQTQTNSHKFSWTAPAYNPGGNNSYTITSTFVESKTVQSPDGGTRVDYGVANPGGLDETPTPQSSTITITVVPKTWAPGDPIQGGSYSGPPIKLMVGDTKQVSVSTATDTDTWTAPDLPPGIGTDVVSYVWAGTGVTSVDLPSLTWTAPSAAENYTLTCTVDDAGLVPTGDLGTTKDGPLSPVATITMQVMDFTPSITDPQPIAVSVGGTETVQALVTPINGFNRSVTFLPDPTDTTGISVSGSGRSGAVTLTVGAGSVAAGTYTVLVDAQCGSVTHTLTLGVTITGPRTWSTGTAEAVDASIVTVPSTASTTVPAGGTLTLSLGGSDSDNWVVTGTTQSGTDPDSLHFVWNDGDGETDTGNTFVWHAPAYNTSGGNTYTVTCLVTEQKTVQSPDVGYRVDNPIDATDLNTPGPVSRSIAVTVAPVAGFVLSTDQTSYNAQPGGTAAITTTVTPLPGYSGTVTVTPSSASAITVAPLPTSAAVADPTPLVVGGTITVPSSVVPGTYTITLTGTDTATPPNASTCTFTVVVDGFTLAATQPTAPTQTSPVTVNVPLLGTASTTITVTPTPTYNGTVTLTDNADITLAAGFGAPSVYLNGDAPETTTLTFSPSIAATIGPHPVLVTGTNLPSGPSASTTVTVNVTDFSLSSSPTTALILPQGQSASQTTGGPPPCAGSITTAAIAGFTGPVALTQTSYTDSSGTVHTGSMPTGVTVTIAPSAAVLTTSLASVVSTVTFGATSGAATGTYTITFSGTSGSRTQTATLKLTVSAAAGASTSWIEVDHINTDGSAGAALANPIGDTVDVSLVLQVAPGDQLAPSSAANLLIAEDSYAMAQSAPVAVPFGSPASWQMSTNGTTWTALPSGTVVGTGNALPVAGSGLSTPGPVWYRWSSGWNTCTGPLAPDGQNGTYTLDLVGSSGTTPIQLSFVSTVAGSTPYQAGPSPDSADCENLTIADVSGPDYFPRGQSISGPITIGFDVGDYDLTKPVNATLTIWPTNRVGNDMSSSVASISALVPATSSPAAYMSLTWDGLVGGQPATEGMYTFDIVVSQTTASDSFAYRSGYLYVAKDDVSFKDEYASDSSSLHALFTYGLSEVPAPMTVNVDYWYGVDAAAATSQGPLSDQVRDTLNPVDFVYDGNPQGYTVRTIFVVTALDNDPLKYRDHAQHRMLPKNASSQEELVYFYQIHFHSGVVSTTDSHGKTTRAGANTDRFAIASSVWTTDSSNTSWTAISPLQYTKVFAANSGGSWGGYCYRNSTDLTVQWTHGVEYVNPGGAAPPYYSVLENYKAPHSSSTTNSFGAYPYFISPVQLISVLPGTQYINPYAKGPHRNKLLYDRWQIFDSQGYDIHHKAVLDAAGNVTEADSKDGNGDPGTPTNILPSNTFRRVLRIHFDAGAPGTDGCLGIRDVTDYVWLNDHIHKIRNSLYYPDYGIPQYIVNVGDPGVTPPSGMPIVGMSISGVADPDSNHPGTIFNGFKINGNGEVVTSE